jgi:hypothetical protein
MQFIDQAQLDEIHGGAKDPLGETALVAGRPQTCAAMMARADKLFAPDNKVSNETFFREYRNLRDGWNGLRSFEGCPPDKP